MDKIKLFTVHKTRLESDLLKSNEKYRMVFETSIFFTHIILQKKFKFLYLFPYWKDLHKVQTFHEIEELKLRVEFANIYFEEFNKSLK